MKKLKISMLLLTLCSGSVMAQVNPVTSGLVLSLDAAIGFNPNGGAAATWLDQSGAGNTVTTATGADPLSVSVGGYTAIRFNGSSRMQSATTNTINGTSGTMFVVTANGTTTGLAPGAVISVAAPGTVSNEMLIQGYVAYHHSSESNWIGKAHQCTNIIPNNSRIITTGVWTPGTGVNDVDHYNNGILSTQPISALGTAANYTAVARRAYIGARLHGTIDPYMPFTGDIYEVLVYNRELTVAEVNSVNNYLKCKYQVNYTACNEVISCSAKNCSDTCSWNVQGNNILNGNNIFGTLTNDNVRIQTNNTDRGILTKDGLLGWNTTVPTAYLHVNCNGHNEQTGTSDVRFENLERGDGQIVVIDEQGYVYNSGVSTKGLAEQLAAQKSLIEKMQQDIIQMQARISELTGSNTTKVTDNTIGDHSKLYQNTPNPFGSETRIEYYVAKMNASSYIMVYDLNGKELKRFLIHTAGKGAVTLSSETMLSGMYLYSLIVDGHEVDSKRMTLIK